MEIKFKPNHPYIFDFNVRMNIYKSKNLKTYPK